MRLTGAQEVMSEWTITGYTIVPCIAGSHRGVCCTYLRSDMGIQVLGHAVAGVWLLACMHD